MAGAPTNAPVAPSVPSAPVGTGGTPEAGASPLSEAAETGTGAGDSPASDGPESFGLSALDLFLVCAAGVANSTFAAMPASARRAGSSHQPRGTYNSRSISVRPAGLA